MRWLVGLIARSFLYFSAATMAALFALVIVLWMKGHLTTDKTMDVIAAAYGINVPDAAALAAAEQPQVKYDDVLEKRSLASMDQDLREQFLDKAIGEFLNRQTQLDDDRKKYNQLFEQFEQRLTELREGAVTGNLRDAAQTLEVLRPEQAKEQILKLLAEEDGEDDVVTLLGLLPKDVRKRLLGEFSVEESDKLYVILKAILSGSAEGDLIDSVQNQIDEFKNNQT